MELSSFPKNRDKTLYTCGWRTLIGLKFKREFRVLDDDVAVLYVCMYVCIDLPRSLYVELSSDCVLETKGHREKVGQVILKSQSLLLEAMLVLVVSAGCHCHGFNKTVVQ